LESDANPPSQPHGPPRWQSPSAKHSSYVHASPRRFSQRPFSPVEQSSSRIHSLPELSMQTFPALVLTQTARQSVHAGGGVQSASVVHGSASSGAAMS
jgi:hypothetical protein